MVYVILIAGIVLIICSFIRNNSIKGRAAEEDIGLESSGPVQFEGMLNENLMLKKLDSLEEKLVYMEEAFEELKDKIADSTPGIENIEIDTNNLKDTNTRILVLKDKGLNVEEIASILGLTKGEVLLRLGMKK